MNNPNRLSCCKCSNPLTLSCEISGWSLIEYILFCHTLWWIFYYFLLIVTKQSEEWCCRLLTFFHGCLISYCALRDAYVNKSPIDFKRTPLSEPKKYYLSYMFSYFLFDFCWIHFFGNETKIIYAHHIASILIIFNVLLRNFGAPGIAYGAAGLEMTNPYLQLRWFLRTHGYQDTPIHKAAELWFIFLFSVIRIIGGTVLVYYAVLHSDMDYLTKLSFIFIYGISLVLQWQIIVFFRKKYFHAGNRVLFIHSRVSISLYFQRRTLDQYLPNPSDEHNENQEPTTHRESLSKNFSTRKESSSSKKLYFREETSAHGEFSNKKFSLKEETSAHGEFSNKKFSLKEETSAHGEFSNKKFSLKEEASAHGESSNKKFSLKEETSAHGEFSNKKFSLYEEIFAHGESSNKIFSIKEENSVSIKSSTHVNPADEVNEVVQTNENLEENTNPDNNTEKNE